MSSWLGTVDAEYRLEFVLLLSGALGGVSVEPRRRSSGEAMAWYRLAMLVTLTGMRGVSRVGD